MDIEIAELIQSNPRDAIWPYLVLRSWGTMEPHRGIDLIAAQNKFGEVAIKVLSLSGFIKIVDGNILLRREDGTWLYQPAKPLTRRSPQTPNFDKQLERIAKLAGYPIDFEAAKGYYRKRFKVLLDKHGFDRIETIAHDNQGLGLRELLVPSIFNSLRVKFEAESLD